MQELHNSQKKLLSIIIVSYNTKDLTQQAIESIQKSLKTLPENSFEIIVVDNKSTDSSISYLQEIAETEAIHLIQNDSNLGFGAANNIGIQKARGKYILLLNSDVIADRVDLAHLIDYLEKNEKVGALTVRVELRNGSIDPASHRGFPTIWNSLCYFSKLEKLTKNIPILSQFFGGYHLTHLNLKSEHEIDSPAAAFYLTRKDILDEINGFDEAYFMYGEDVDLSYRIKQKGYKILYYPQFTVLHLKRQSGLDNSSDQQKQQTRKHFYEAMKIFYKTHYAPQHSVLVNKIIYWAIDLKAKL